MLQVNSVSSPFAFAFAFAFAIEGYMENIYPY